MMELPEEELSMMPLLVKVPVPELKVKELLEERVTLELMEVVPGEEVVVLTVPPLRRRVEEPPEEAKERFWPAVGVKLIEPPEVEMEAEPEEPGEVMVRELAPPPELKLMVEALVAFIPVELLKVT